MRRAAPRCAVLCCAAPQGEVVEQQFGEKEIAFRTMDLYTSAVLEATLAPIPQPPQVRAPSGPGRTRHAGPTCAFCYTTAAGL